MRTPQPGGRWLELEQRAGQGFVRNEAGRRGFTDRNAQALAVPHLSARDSLRAITQGAYYPRSAEAVLLPEDVRERQISLVFQHRIGLSRILNVGMTRVRTELFAEAVIAYQR